MPMTAITPANAKARAPLATAPGMANTPGGVDMAHSSAAATLRRAREAYRRAAVSLWLHCVNTSEVHLRRAYDRLVELEQNG